MVSLLSISKNKKKEQVRSLTGFDHYDIRGFNKLFYPRSMARRKKTLTLCRLESDLSKDNNCPDISNEDSYISLFLLFLPLLYQQLIKRYDLSSYPKQNRQVLWHMQPKLYYNSNRYNPFGEFFFAIYLKLYPHN